MIDFERRFIIESGAFVGNTAQLAATKVTTAFRSMGKTLVQRTGNLMMVRLMH